MFEQTDDDDWRQETPFEQNTAELLRQMLAGANWFFWIALFSLVDLIFSLFGIGWGFAVGLGVSQVFDSIGATLFGRGEGTWLNTAVILLDLVVIGLFALFGYFARKANMMAFVTGLILYVLDTVIYIFNGTIAIREFFNYSGAITGIIIHGVAIFFIFRGLLAARKLNE